MSERLEKERLEKRTATHARARARVVDDIVVDIARSMVDGSWKPIESVREIAKRENVKPATVQEWAAEAGRMLRVGDDVARYRGMNLQRLDETYLRSLGDPKAAVAVISEQNRMLGLHAPERVNVTVKAYADLDDETMLARIEERIAEYQRLRERLKAKLRIVDAEPVEVPALPAKGETGDDD